MAATTRRLGAALAVGFRPSQPMYEVVLAFALVLAFPYVFSWISAYIGLTLRDPDHPGYIEAATSRTSKNPVAKAFAAPNRTTFRFTGAAPHEVLGMAMRAAGGQDVGLGGGPATIRQFLAAGLVDELHLVIAPVLLGEGERLFGDLPAGITGYSCSGLTCSAGIAHARITRMPETGR